MSDSWASLARTPGGHTATILLAVAIALTAFGVLLALPSPAFSQEVTPVATIVPDGSPTPTATSTPAALPDLSGRDEGEGLFFEIGGEPPPSPGVETLASRFVGINFGQLDPSLTSASRSLSTEARGVLSPRTVTLNLFDDAAFTGRIEHVEPTASGYAFWGGLDRVELGTMTMVVNGDIVVGTVRTPDAVYTIRTAESGSYVIREIDESTLPPLAEPLEAPPDSDEDLRQALDESVPPDDGSEIDLMVLYTPAARSLEGGRAGIEALIDLYVVQTNQAYAYSGAFQRLRLVLKQEVDYVESDGTLTDLRRLWDNSDGYMDHIHDLRDTYAADLVHLIFSRDDVTEVAGRATFERPFGVTLAAPWGGLVFAHELGHNMGLHHDRYVLIGQSGESSVDGSHFGYVNQRAFEPSAPDLARWRTVMSYPTQCEEVLGEDANCRWLLYFSNPHVTYRSDPMGVSADHPSTGVDGPADAVRTLNERRGTTANFRRSASSTPRGGLTLSRYRLSEKGGISTVSATLHRPSSEDTTVTISVSPDTAVTLSKDRTLTIPAGRTVSGGVVRITGVDNDDQTGSVEVTVSATATNTSTEGVVAPRSVTLYVIDDDADVEPVFVIGSVAYTFTAGKEDSRTLPEATGGNKPLTYSLSPEPDNGVTFVSGPPARIEVSTASVASDETSHTLTVTDSDGDTDSLALSITVRSPGCDGSSAVSGYSGAGIVADCETLLASRDVLRGEQSLNWNMDLPIDDWEGVEIRSDRVFGIDLREGELSGSLPAELGNLTDLNYLWLAGNELSGPIPPELGNLPKLWNLWITNNNLSGPIPPELGKLTDLRYLSIGLNELSGPIPPELGNLPNLETLWLAFTELSGPIPPELGNLANLSGLYIGSNQLSGLIPPELGNLSNLQDLYIDHNRLSGPIPPELGKLVNLETLHLGSNELYGRIPPELGKLTNLETLWLAGNQFSGCVPDVLFDVLKNDLSQSGIPSCGVLLNGLTISPGALVPPFDPELTSYTTVVGQSQITISPTYGSNVALQILDQDGSAIPDADSSLAGHQIDLDAGVIIISLRLSTRDGNQTAGHYTIWVNRASAPGAPVIESIAPGGQSLTVDWNAPAETGGAEVASYDVRFASESADKSDRNWTVTTEVWTGGSRRYTITGLEADVSYDVQVRAVHGAGVGPWSETSVGTPTAVAETCIEPITGSTTIYGTWNGGCESTVRTGSYARFYTFTLGEPRDVAITLESEVDTYLYVREGEGTDGRIVYEDDDDDNSVFSLASSTDSGISETLSAGAYTIEATTVTAGVTGEFTLTIRGATGTYDALFDRYDTDDNGQIDKPEVIAAVRDYLGGQITKAQVVEVIRHYIIGPPTPTPPVDRAALVALYNSTDGSNWTRNDNWLSERPLDEWFGVSTGRNDHVVGLSLRGNNLVGEIPSELGNLSGLTLLLLGHNRLSGAIPPELGNLSSLEALDLWANQLNGEIPKELGNLSNLEWLDLDINQLSGTIPPELGNLSNLENLYLWANHLNGQIPAELGRLSNLESLDLSDNQLSGEIPSALGSLSNLKSLYIEGNQLSGEIPPNLLDIAGLIIMALWGNQISGDVPEHAAETTFLTTLYNSTDGVDWAENENWASAEPVFKWYGVGIDTRGRVTALWLYYNDLSGELPEELENLSHLKILYLEGNQLTGCIPGGLQDVLENDLDYLGLPYCDDTSAGHSPELIEFNSERDRILENIRDKRRPGGRHTPDQ